MIGGLEEKKLYRKYKITSVKNDDYLEDKYEREVYLRAQAQYKNRAQQTPLSTNNTPRTNSGDTLSQLANTADLFDTCEINGVPVSCQELINKGNQIISQTPILR